MEEQKALFETVFAENLDRVQRIVAKHTANPEDARDLTQEVFINAYRGFANFRGDSSISTWLYKIALTTCAQHARSHANRRTVTLSDVEPFLPAEGLEGFDGVFRAEEQASVREALGQLPREQQLVLVLRFSEQLKICEIAEVTGISPETVKTRLRRGLDKLQRILASGGPVGSGEVSLERLPVPSERGARIYHSLGTLYLKKGLVEAALREWQTAQKVDPSFAEPYISTAQQYIKWSQPQKAVEILESAVEKAKSGGLHTKLAFLYLDQDDLYECRDHSFKAVEFAPADPDAHYAAGWAYFMLGFRQENFRRKLPDLELDGTGAWNISAGYFQTAIELKPDMARARSSLALTYAKSGREEEAASECKRALELAGDDLPVLRHAGSVYLNIKRMDEAEKLILRSLERERHVSSIWNLGYIYQLTQRPAEAYVKYREALEMGHMKSDAAKRYHGLAEMAFKSGLTDEAMEAALRSLKHDPEHPETTRIFARAALANGENPAWVAGMIRESLDKHPKHKRLLHLLVECLLLQGRPDEALVQAEVALSEEPENPCRWFGRARTYRALGRYEEALGDCEKACEMDPDFPDFRKELEELKNLLYTSENQEADNH